MPRNPDSYWMDPDEEDQILSESMQRRQKFAVARGAVTPEMAQKAQRLLVTNSNLSAALMQALAQSDVPDETAQQMIDEDDGGLFDRIKGGVGDVVGTVAKHAGSGIEWALSDTYEYAIKPTLRGAFLITEGLSQELVQRPITAALATAQGEGGSLTENYRDYGDSALLNLAQGDLDNDAEGGVLGRGIVPGGQAQEEQRRERVLQINGQTANVGQGFANAFVGEFSNPGDRLYDTVAGVSGFAVEVGLDPSAWATGGLSKARHANMALKMGDANAALLAAGGVKGARRNTVLVEQARNFFSDEKLLGRIAEADAYDLYQSWSRSPANRIDMATIGALGDAKTEAEVAELLFGAVANGDITRKGVLSGPGHAIRQVSLRTPGLRAFTPEGKLAGISPNGVISADNIDEAVDKVDSLLRQANVGRDFRKVIFNDMAKIEPGRFDDLFDVTTDALDLVARQVGDGKLASLKGVARHYADELEAFRQYGVDSWGDPVNVPYAKTKVVQNFDGEDIETIIPTPQMTSELNSLALTLPDATEIRRAATKNDLMRKVYQSKGWEVTADSTRWITQTLFKPAALLRPAYVVRIGMEEQARLAALHHDSVFNHPFRYLMANVVNRKALKDLDGEDLTMVAKATDVITKDAHGVVADRVGGRARVFGQTTVSLDETSGVLTEMSYKGWRGELGQISSAPEARKLAELRGNTDEFKLWAQNEGREHIERLAKVNDEAGSLLEFGDDFDLWADGLKRRISSKTGWDDEIIEHVVNGTVPFDGAGKALKNTNAGFQQFLSRKFREIGGPGKVKVEHIPETRTKMLDSALSTAFDYITGKPTSYLARFPAFRQGMITRGADMMDGLANDGLRRQALEAFEKNMGLTRAEMKSLRKAADNAAGKQGIVEDLTDFNQLVVNKAAEDAKHLLFDVTRRGAAQEAAVAIVPFLDAWKEVTMAWSRMLKDNPAFFIRAQAGYRNLKENGTFYANEFGEEVFRYPGGGFLSTFVDEMNQRGGGVENLPMAAIESVGRVATGDTPDYSVAAEGSLQGLNLIATGVGPGVGPVIQWGASTFKSPDAQKLREFIAPFGTGAVEDPEDLLNFPNIAESLIPAWARKVINATTEGKLDERQWNSTVGDAMRALVASGQYDPADQDKLMADAERYASYLLLFRGVTQATGPTGPNMSHQVAADETDTASPDWDPENDPEGKMFFLSAMREDYFRLAEKYGHDEGATKFFDLYGMEPFFIAQAKSTTHGAELPVDEEGDRWMVRNADAVDDHRLVAGYFAPLNEDASFDFSVFSAQQTRGQRKSLTPDEQVRLATQARARAMWQNIKTQTEILPPKQRDMARAQAKAQLEKVHPGWEQDVLAMPTSEDKIAELRRAAEDPRLANEPLTKPLQEYLAMRDMALLSVQVRSGSPTATLTREDAKPQRQMLNEMGLMLAQKHPSFLGVWSTLLKRELEED